jgi:hypothetical protein
MDARRPQRVFVCLSPSAGWHHTAERRFTRLCDALLLPQAGCLPRRLGWRRCWRAASRLGVVDD